MGLSCTEYTVIVRIAYAQFRRVWCPNVFNTKMTLINEGHFAHNAAMDITDKLLNALEVRVEPFAICDVRCGRHLDVKAEACTTIHYTLSGNGQITVNKDKVIPLKADQIILIPPGMSQRIESQQSDNFIGTKPSHCLKPAEGLHWLKAGTGDTDIILACGRIHVTYGKDLDIFGLLAEPIVESFQNSA